MTSETSNFDYLALKDEGNALYLAGDFLGAVQKYSKALKLCADNNTDRTTLLKNRAAACLNLREYQKAIEDTTAALEITPSDIKALYRRCQAYEQLGKYNEAFEDARAVNRLNPQNSAIQPYLRRLQEIAKKMSTPKTKSPPSNLQLVSDKEVAISLERLIDSVVGEVTAHRSALQPQQVNESNDDAVGINSLRDEIIEEVFGYLTQNQLGQIARVCRRWNVLIKSPVLWRKVNVKIFSSVREKNDKERKNVAESFINGLPSCVTFIRLDFSECRGSIEVDFWELCVKLHENCPHLEELILARCDISNLLPVVINLCTQFLQCVKKLVFHYCRFARYFRTVDVNNNSKIEVLNLYRCDFPYFSKTQLSKLLYLKELCSAFTNVNDTWFEDNASFLNQLHVLNLGWTRITARTFLAIQNHCHNLKELYLCKCDLGIIDHNVNFNNSIFPQLKKICLSHYEANNTDSRVTCEGVVSLIQSCPSLENVYVNERVAGSFAAHPFVVANRCKSGIVKAIGWYHNHNVDYSLNLTLL